MALYTKKTTVKHPPKPIRPSFMHGAKSLRTRDTTQYLSSMGWISGPERVETMKGKDCKCPLEPEHREALGCLYPQSQWARILRPLPMTVAAQDRPVECWNLWDTASIGTGHSCPIDLWAVVNCYKSVRQGCPSSWVEPFVITYVGKYCHLLCYDTTALDLVIHFVKFMLPAWLTPFTASFFNLFFVSSAVAGLFPNHTVKRQVLKMDVYPNWEKDSGIDS